MHEQLLEPVVSTCYGLFWFLLRICGCHSLEGVAWSRPISTRRNSKTLVRQPRIEDCFFCHLCVCLSSSDHAGATASWLSALLFAHLCSCSHKHLSNMVRWQPSTPCWSELVHEELKESTHSWQNHHTPGKTHALGSCGTAVGTILLKKLLGHGLATQKERDSAVFLEDSSQSLQERLLLALPSLTTLASWRFSCVLHSLSFECASMNSGVSLRSRKLKELLGHCP